MTPLYKDTDIKEIKSIDTAVLLYEEIERYFKAAKNLLKQEVEPTFGYFDKSIDLMTGRLVGLQFASRNTFSWCKVPRSKILVGYENPRTRISQSLTHIYDEMGSISVSVICDESTWASCDKLVNYVKNLLSSTQYNVYTIGEDQWEITLKALPIAKNFEDIKVDGVHYREYFLTFDLYLTKNAMLSNRNKYYITYKDNIEVTDGEESIVSEDEVYELAILGGMGDTYSNATTVDSKLTKDFIGNSIGQAAKGFAWNMYLDMKNPILLEWYRTPYTGNRIKTPYYLIIESPIFEFETGVKNRSYYEIFIENLNPVQTIGAPITMTVSAVPV